MAGDYRDQLAFEKYLRELQRFCTPDQFGSLLRHLGSPDAIHKVLNLLEQLGGPDEAQRKLAAIENMLERQQRWEWLGGGIRKAAQAALWVGGAVLLFRDVLPVVFAWFGGSG